MVRYQQADSEAVLCLVDALSPQLYRFFVAQARCPQDADDMLQDLWLRIHRVRHTYRPGEPLLAWVYAIARRVRVDAYRKRIRTAKKEVAMETLPELVPAAASTTPVSFEEMIAHLPDGQRELLTMLKMEGLSIENAARATSTTVGAVKQKVHRAYENIRRVLGRDSLELP